MARTYANGCSETRLWAYKRADPEVVWWSPTSGVAGQLAQGLGGLALALTFLATEATPAVEFSADADGPWWDDGLNPADPYLASGRPHLHLYIGLPETMSQEDFAGLRERTLQRHRLERQYGRYEGRKRTPPVGGIYGGEFGACLRTAWSEVVGTNDPDKKEGVQDGAKAHQLRGVDVAVMFWSDDAEAQTDRTAVAQYLAREAGKSWQKKPPPGFFKVGRFYGLWGKSVGFVPEAITTVIEPAVAQEVEARLARWVNWKLAVLRKGAPPASAVVRRSGDGITAFGLGPEQTARILRRSKRAAAKRLAEGSPRRAGGAAPGGAAALLRLLDMATGEILTVPASVVEPGPP